MSLVKMTFRENVAIVELNRPKAHALNKHLVNDIRDAFLHLRESKNVEGVILTASGNIFCAGLDVVALPPERMAEIIRAELAYNAASVKRLGYRPE